MQNAEAAKTLLSNTANTVQEYGTAAVKKAKAATTKECLEGPKCAIASLLCCTCGGFPVLASALIQYFLAPEDSTPCVQFKRNCDAGRENKGPVDGSFWGFAGNNAGKILGVKAPEATMR